MSPIALQVAAVLLSLFIATACMATLATLATARLLIEVRAIWDNTLYSAIVAARTAERQLAVCDQEAAVLRSDKAQMKRDYEDLEREYTACTVSLKEARDHVTASRLYYEREPRPDGEGGV